jgi:tRNA nucleotidyltransferase (CCA-adding enzyme)
MLFNILTPQQEEMDRIKKAYEEFRAVVDKVMMKKQFQYELVIYGSSANGLALRSNNSDLDLSLVIFNLP